METFERLGASRYGGHRSLFKNKLLAPIIHIDRKHRLAFTFSVGCRKPGLGVLAAVLFYCADSARI